MGLILSHRCRGLLLSFATFRTEKVQAKEEICLSKTSAGQLRGENDDRCCTPFPAYGVRLRVEGLQRHP